MSGKCRFQKNPEMTIGKNIEMEPKKCPKCSSKNIIPIVYGMPSEETFKESKKGKFILGGCCIEESSPEWHCKKCGHEWGKV
jgi:hypothetical protein